MVEAYLFPPDPEPVESTPPKPVPYGGIISEDDTSHEPLPETRMQMFHVQETQGTSQRIVHIVKLSVCMEQGTFKLPGGRPEEQDAPSPKNNPSK